MFKTHNNRSNFFKLKTKKKYKIQFFSKNNAITMIKAINLKNINRKGKKIINL